MQARTGSSRLPDKVIRSFYRNRSILEELIYRFKRQPGYKLIVATTKEPEDDRICEICRDNKVPFFRGPVENVLERFYLASSEYSIDPIIRICSDNPFLLHSSPGELLEQYRKEKADYIGYRLSGDRVGIKTHFGLWAELISREAIGKVLEHTGELRYLEHVTNYLYERQNNFRIMYLNAPDSVFRRDDIRLTVDSETDFLLVQRIYNQYFNTSRRKEIDIERLIDLIDSHPEWKNEMSNSIEKNEK